MKMSNPHWGLTVNVAQRAKNLPPHSVARVYLESEFHFESKLKLPGCVIRLNRSNLAEDPLPNCWLTLLFEMETSAFEISMP